MLSSSLLRVSFLRASRVTKARLSTMSSPPTTRLLYQSQGDLHTHTAHITHIAALDPPLQQPPPETKDTHVIYLDETIFHVQGGGQPFDTGTVSSLPDEDTPPTPPLSFNVTSVRHGEDGSVRHVGSFSKPKDSLSATSGNPPQTEFSPNARVKLTISTPRRLLNSRIHTAGHMLSAATRQLSLTGHLPEVTELKAQHYPDAAFVDFRGLIDGKYKDMIQAKVNEIVAECRDVKICFWTAEECRENGVIGLDAALAAAAAANDKDNNNSKTTDRVFRAVLIEGYGAYPCGGTHVKETSGVGKITVRRISRQKGTTKISYAVD